MGDRGQGRNRVHAIAPQAGEQRPVRLIGLSQLGHLRMPGRLLGACSGLGGGQGARLAAQCRTPAASSVDERAVRPREAIEQVESGAHVAPRARLEQHGEGVERACAVDLVQPQRERALGCAFVDARDRRPAGADRGDPTARARAVHSRRAHSPARARVPHPSRTAGAERRARAARLLPARVGRTSPAEPAPRRRARSGRRKRTRTWRGYRLSGRRPKPSRPGRALRGRGFRSGRAGRVCWLPGSGSRWISRTASKSVLSILP